MSRQQKLPLQYFYDKSILMHIQKLLIDCKKAAIALLQYPGLQREPHQLFCWQGDHLTMTSQ